MTKNKTGGPAFPVSGEEIGGETFIIHRGISKLDYFAAKAMQAISNTTWNSDASNIAETAYNIAQAMIEEGERRGQAIGEIAETLGVNK